jgi:hypothetical protein
MTHEVAFTHEDEPDNIANRFCKVMEALGLQVEDISNPDEPEWKFRVTNPHLKPEVTPDYVRPCLCCDEDIAPNENTAWENDAFTFQSQGGYGSRFDMQLLNLVICDHCIEKGLKSGTIVDVGGVPLHFDGPIPERQTIIHRINKRMQELGYDKVEQECP